jgi:hypothetical protein
VAPWADTGSWEHWERISANMGGAFFALLGSGICARPVTNYQIANNTRPARRQMPVALQVDPDPETRSYSVPTGLYPIPWGARWLGRFPFASAIKCHQKSTCNSAGSSVGSLVLSTPPGPPAHGRAVGGAAVSCQYFPCSCSCSCSFVLVLSAPSVQLGVKPPLPLPLRASSRGY